MYSRFVSSVRDALAAHSERRKPTLYRSWSAQLQKVVGEKLIPLLCSMRDAADPPARQTLFKQVCEVLTDVTPQLSSVAYCNDVSTEQSVVAAKQSLLELWHHLLDAISAAPPIDCNPQLFNTLTLIMKREEFDVTGLFLDVHRRPTVSSLDIVLAQRYGRMLFATLAYLGRVIGSALEEAQAAVASQTASACSKPIRRSRKSAKMKPVPGRAAAAIAAAEATGEAISALPRRLVEGATGQTSSPPVDDALSPETDSPPVETELPVVPDLKVDEVLAPGELAAAVAAATGAPATQSKAGSAAPGSRTPSQQPPPLNQQLGSAFLNFAARALAVLYFRTPARASTPRALHDEGGREAL
eukprot:m51a1_g1570 hypothetical protein (357) ;mRNA; r:68490-70041